MDSVIISTIGTSVVATMDSTHTGTKSIYHCNCEVLIDSPLNQPQCTSCKKHRKSLSAMASHPQKDERTHPSSHTTYDCLTLMEMKGRLHRVNTELKLTKLQLAHMERKYQRESVKRVYT